MCLKINFLVSIVVFAVVAAQRERVECNQPIENSRTIRNSEIDDKIMHLLDKYRDVLARGDWVFPPLDPLIVDDFNIRYEKNNANITGNFSMVVKGVTNYTDMFINTGDFFESTWESSMNLPVLDIEGSYMTSGQIGKKMPINGKGNFSCRTYNMSMRLTYKISNGPTGNMQLDKMKIVLGMSKLDFEVHGLVGGPIYDKLISALVSNSAPLFVNANIPFFDTVFSRLFIKLFNPVLAKYTLDQLYDLINNLE